MNILFVANGDFDLSNLELNLYDKICCVDGGLDKFVNFSERVPDIICGDFDSLDKSILNKYLNKSLIIKKDNQDVSDLLYALEYCLKYYKIKSIHFAGLIGNRVDHSLCNIILLNKVPNNIDAKIIAKNEEIFLLKNSLDLNNVLGKTISLIPLTNIDNIKTNGLKWELNNINLEFGFINGISNIATSKDIKITIDNGRLLVVLNKEV